MNEIMSADDFETAIKNGVTLIDFNAPWCAPCKAQEPILAKLATQFEGKAQVFAMNIDNNREIAGKLGIQSIPTLIIFKNGKEIQRFVGLQPENTLADVIKNLLN